MAKRTGVYEDALSARATNLYLDLFRLWSGPEELRMMDNMLTEIRIKRPPVDGGETLVIVKAWDGTKKFVAFHSAVDASEALSGALSRCKSEALKWREDKYQVPGLPAESEGSEG